MLAGEVLAPLQNAQEKGLDHVEETEMRPNVAISVGLNTSTYQALSVLNDSGGVARSASDAEMISMQKLLAQEEGIYAEASSVLSLAVIEHLIQAGAIDPDETVVAMLTSSGLKHPEMTAENLMEIPLIEPELDALTQLLSETYNLDVADPILAHAQGPSGPATSSPPKASTGSSRRRSRTRSTSAASGTSPTRSSL